MRPFIFCFGILIILFSSCKEKSTSSPAVPADGSAETKNTAPASPACYMSVVNQDTFKLKLRYIDIMASGILDYTFHEKDRNIGQLTGVLHGDTLVADYTFISEGKTSVRQVAFLLHANTAIEGYGPMEEKNGKMVFKSRKTLAFGEGVKMNQIDCAYFVEK